MKTSPVKSVDEYLENLPQDQKVVLQKLRSIIKNAAPKAQECISYQIPAYKQNGPVIYFAAFKNHLSIYPVTGRVKEELHEELKPYLAAKASLHFTVDKPLPESLVKKFIKIRIEENEERISSKNK